MDARADDRQEIHDIVLKYSRGVGRGDGELLRSCYHPDALDDHGPFYGLGHDFVSVACLPTFDAYDSMMHYVTNEMVEFEGANLAHGETYFVARMRRTENSRSVLETIGGRYVDRYERRDGAWRIAHRVTVYEWGDSKTPSDAFPPDVDSFEHGRRFDSDVAYTHSTTRREPAPNQ